MITKIMSLCLTLFFVQNQKENIWEWEMTTICEKTKKTTRKKIKLS